MLYSNTLITKHFTRLFRYDEPAKQVWPSGKTDTGSPRLLRKLVMTAEDIRFLFRKMTQLIK